MDLLYYTDAWEYLYNRNSQGYRCAEFNSIAWDRAIAVFGCSEVFGVSVPTDQTLTHYLSTTFDRPCINLGVPGVSNRTITDHMLYWHQHLPIRHSMVFWTSPYRYQYYNVEYDCIMDITPRGVYQPEHASAVAQYRQWCSSPKLVRKEFRDCRRRVAHLPVVSFTILGEAWQAPVIVSDIVCRGLDRAHSAGARCADFAQQVYNHYHV